MSRPHHEIGSDIPPRAAEVEPPAIPVFHAGGSADHASDVTIPAGMKPWHGGEIGPDDWDGWAALDRAGLPVAPQHHPEFWNHARPNGDPRRDIVGYSPKAKATDRSREAEALELLELLVGYDDEARPNGIMDCVDTDGTPYQSATLAGLMDHARALIPGNSVAERAAAYRAALHLGDSNGQGPSR